MNKQLPEISFKNRDNPKSYFEIVKIEELLQRSLDHEIDKNHLVKFYIIFLVYKGQGYHTIDFIDYKYEEATVLIIRKNQIHKFIRNSDVKGYLLIFTEEFIISHLNRMEALKSMQLFNESLSLPAIEIDNKEDFSDLLSLIRHIEYEYDKNDHFSVGITRSALHILMTKLFRIKAKSEQFVDRKKYMAQFLVFQELVEEECFNNRKVQYYANRMGISTKTLNNIVNDVLNVSAKSFIDERTIMQIKRLLISSNYSIKEIAYDVGFSDPTNFFKYFKKFTNSSPEAFRQEHQ